MADKSIVELGIAQQMTDDALLPVYQGGETRSIEGALIKKYARDSVKVYTDAAREHADAAEASKNAAAQSAAKAEENADKTAADVLVVKSAADAERGRVAAEDVRRTAETSRETEEGKRAAAEGIRAASETARREAEEGREAAEQLRADETAGIVARAKVHADDAAASKAAAAISETNAGTSAANAAKSKADALTAQKAAEAAKSAAESSATLAGGEAEKASQSAASAGNSATEAAGSATAASEAKADAEDAKAAAQTAQAGAEVAKAAAQTAQGKAEAARDAAGVSAAGAADSATAAGASSTAAAGSAQTTIAKAGEAAASAGAAKTSETNAKSSETAAGESADAAEQARQAIEALGVQGVTLSPGSQVAVEKLVDADGAVTLKFSIPQGAKGDKGEIGDQGVSVASIKRTSGTGAAGTTDTYTITLSSGATSTFQVYNGRDGEGAGDMTASVYDPQGKSQDVFAYTDTSIAELWTKVNELPSGEPMIVTVTETDGVYSADYTAKEVVEAVEAGKRIFVSVFSSGQICIGLSAYMNQQDGDAGYYIARFADADYYGSSVDGQTVTMTCFTQGEEVFENSVALGRAVIRGTPDGTSGEIASWDRDRRPIAATPSELGLLTESGGTLTGPLAMSGNKVTGVGAPTADDDAATKGYTDDAVEKHILTANRNVYVSNDGSDETGDGTMANPWATIQKAVDEAPEECGAFTYRVYVSAGTYAGFTVTGKTIFLSQNVAGDTYINSKIMVQAGGFLQIQFKVTVKDTDTGTGLTVSRNGFVLCSNGIAFDNCKLGALSVANGSRFVCSLRATITNCGGTAIKVGAASTSYILIIGGAGNARNIVADGGVLSYKSSEISPGTYPDQAINGGIITNDLLNASQKGVPGGLATLDENGKVFGEQLPAMDYDPTGSAAAVDAKLTTHTGDSVKHITAAERTAWDGKEGAVKGAGAKTTLADGDGFVLVDTTSATKRITWANVVTAVKAKLGTVYAALSHTHPWGEITGAPTSMTPTAHKTTHKTGGTDALIPGDIGAAERKTAAGTLSTAGWTGSAGNWSQAVSVSWMLATDVPKARLTGATAAQMDAWDTLEPYADSAAGKVMFYCKQTAKPTAAMSIEIEVIR